MVAEIKPEEVETPNEQAEVEEIVEVIARVAQMDTEREQKSLTERVLVGLLFVVLCLIQPVIDAAYLAVVGAWKVAQKVLEGCEET